MTVAIELMGMAFDPNPKCSVGGFESPEIWECRSVHDGPIHKFVACFQANNNKEQ